MKEIINQLYLFITGPMIWISLIFFLGGLLARVAFLYYLSKKQDRVFYNHMNFSWRIKSILHWLVPWANASTRNQPLFTLTAFLFHLPILGVPLFFDAHNMLWEEAFGIGFWSLPDVVADVLTVVMICAGISLFIRRILRPEVRILTSTWDYMVLIITILPFLSGFLAHHQWGPYDFLFTLHIISSEMLLILIPFTKLGHMILFFFTRAFIGFEMGGRRGAHPW